MFSRKFSKQCRLQKFRVFLGKLCGLAVQEPWNVNASLSSLQLVKKKHVSVVNCSDVGALETMECHSN